MKKVNFFKKINKIKQSISKRKIKNEVFNNDVKPLSDAKFGDITFLTQSNTRN